MFRGPVNASSILSCLLGSWGMGPGVVHILKAPGGVHPLMTHTCGISCRLAEEEVIKHITTTDNSIQRTQALGLLRSWYLGMPQMKVSDGQHMPAWC